MSDMLIMCNQKPLVSVIITTYNRESIIAGAIETVLEQSYPNIEIIVVDDNSEYNIEKKLSIFSAKIRLLTNDKNRGANWSRAKGISAANGEYIAFLDDDDRWKSKKIEKQVEVMQQSDSIGLVTTGYISQPKGVRFPDLPDSDSLTKQLLLANNFVGGYSMIMVRYDIIQKAGLPDINLPSSQDLEWYIRISQQGEFKEISEPLVIYGNKSVEATISSSKVSNKTDSYGEILIKHEDLVLRYGYLFKRMTWSERNVRLAKYSILNGEYLECVYFSIMSILKYPLNVQAYATLFIGLSGNTGLSIAKKIRSSI